MKTVQNSKILDYLPPVVAFGAALVAIIGDPKWNGGGIGLEKITATGWIVAAISLAALGTTLLVTARNQRQQTSQKALRTQIARIGREQLLRGVKRTVCVFKESRFWDKGHAEPKSPLDLLSNERRYALAAINLNGASDYASGKGQVKWWEMFENTATEGASQITTALTIYVTFFDSVLIEAATKLLNSEFMFRLKYTHEIIDANTRGEPDRSVQFFWASPDEHMRSGYEEFWPLVAQVMQLCSDHQGTWD